MCEYKPGTFQKKIKNGNYCNYKLKKYSRLGIISLEVSKHTASINILSENICVRTDKQDVCSLRSWELYEKKHTEIASSKVICFHRGYFHYHCFFQALLCFKLA